MSYQTKKINPLEPKIEESGSEICALSVHFCATYTFFKVNIISTRDTIKNVPTNAESNS